jgi:putative ABC transport system permease protein
MTLWDWLFRRAQREKDLDEEVQSHLRMAAQERTEQGESAEQARTAALREFGNATLIKETTRAMWGWVWLETLLQDLRYGLRQLRKSPGFTTVAVVTLALGIGANTAVFSLVDTILLRPLPYRNPSELLLVSETLPQMGGDTEIGVAAAEYLDYRDRNRSFVQTGAYEAAGFNLTGEGNPLRVNAAAVSASVFSLLGVPPRLGRFFTADEERFGGAPVAVLSYSLWQRHYGGDPEILGKTIKLDEKPYLVVGIMPPSFLFPSDGAPLSERADLWVPEVLSPEDLKLQNRVREFGVGFIGRLKPGVSEQQAQEDVASVAAGFMQQYRDIYSGTIWVAPHVHRFAAYAVRKARPLMMLLMAAVASVLLIACANVANLLLARGSYRSHEMAVRSAIGATCSRLVRQCLLESLLLSLLGAAAGLALALLLVQGVRAFGPAGVPRLQEVAVELPALLFTVVLLLLTTVLFGFVPAWRLSHVAPQDCLKESSQAGGARGTERLQNFIVVAEIAATLVLLVGAGLLFRSFVRVLNVPLGFRPEGVFIVRTWFDKARYPDPIKREVVQKELIERLAHLQGVQIVAAASHLPLSDTRQIGFRLEHAAPDDSHWAENSLVSPGYFRAMGISILRGRDFTERDRRDTPLVAVINEALARQHFPRQDPIGQRFHWGRALFTIVGIAGDVHISALDADPPPMIYNSMFQVQSGASTRTALILRRDPNGRDKDLVARIQQQVWSLDRDLPIYNFAALDTLISESLAQRRFTTALTLSFGLIALALALIGLFGLMSYLVARRQRELAIRMALGANETGLWRMVMKRGAALAMSGCAIGLALFPLGGGLIRATLYQTSTYDPMTLLLIPLLLFGVALIASYIPARRATKVDPMVALRYE